MVAESIVILVILAVIILFTFRKNRKEYFVLIAPILTIPFFYILFAIINTIAKKMVVDALAAVIVGAVVGMILMIIASRFLKSPKQKIAYTIFGALSIFGLMIAYLVNIK